MQTRKKRSRKSSSKGAYETPRTIDEAGIHLPAFMMGLITSLFLLLLGISQIMGSSSSKRVLELVESGEDPSVVSLIATKDFDEALKSGNSRQLSVMLAGLNNWDRQADVPIQVQSNRRRIDVANQLLTMPLDEKQRGLAIDSKIDALSSIYGLDLLNGLQEPNVAQTLKATAEKYLTDGNASISRRARMANLKLDAFELIKERHDADLQPVANQVVELLQDYPDDEMVIATIKIIVMFYNQYNSGYGNKHGLALMQLIQADSSKFDSPQVMDLIESFSDESKMQLIGYQKAFENRWVNGRVGQKKLLESSLELIADPKVGRDVINYVDSVCHWFEQENQLDRTTMIYEEMLKTSNAKANAKSRSLASLIATDGLKRSKLLNQKFKFRGTTAELSQLDSAGFEGKPTIVLFWSSGKHSSVEALHNIYDGSVAWRRNGGKILAVATTGEVDSQLKRVVAEMPGVDFVVGDTGESRSSGISNPIYEQCPSVRVPRAILINHEGIVVDINVPISDLKTECSMLMSDR